MSQNPQTIDSLIYTYSVGGTASGNLLGKVADPTGNKNGFTDGTNGSDDYTYDTQGNLTADQNKGIDSLKYNAQGKVSRIKFHDGRLMVYTYDGAGTKLKTALTVSGTTTTTDYVNGFVYTNGALSFFSSPEGRVVKNGSSFEYQYAIADHQGNTRVVFTSATPTAQSVSAGFESANQTSESANFLNYPSGAHINTVVSNAHTGNNSLYLNGATNYQVGLAKTYTLLPGDQVQIQAYAKYSTPSGTSSNLTGFATALLNAFNLSAPASGETGTPSAGVNTYGGQAAAGFGDGSSDNTHPRVFVNILVFDKNYNFMDIAYQQTTSSGAQISATYTAKEAGYAYVYVSNEQTNQTDVYFDDITMTLTPTRILQVNEYYPFGLQTASSITRPGSTNNFLYDAGNELNTTTGFYDLPFRNYDASVGRFFQVDPLAHTSHDLNPFHYAGNNPIGSNDPSGLTQQYYANPEDDPRWQISHPPGGSGGGQALTDAIDREFDTSWANDIPVSTWWAEQTQGIAVPRSQWGQLFRTLGGGGDVTVFVSNGQIASMAYSTGSTETSGAWSPQTGFISAKMILFERGMQIWRDWQEKTSYETASVSPELLGFVSDNSLPGQFWIDLYLINKSRAEASAMMGQAFLENGIMGDMVRGWRQRNSSGDTNKLIDALSDFVGVMKKSLNSKWSDLAMFEIGSELYGASGTYNLTNEYVIAPIILRENRDWYNHNISQIDRYTSSGGGTSGEY